MHLALQVEGDARVLRRDILHADALFADTFDADAFAARGRKGAEHAFVAHVGFDVVRSDAHGERILQRVGGQARGVVDAEVPLSKHAPAVRLQTGVNEHVVKLLSSDAGTEG